MRKIKYRKVRKVQPNYFEYTGIYKTEPVEMQLFIYNDSEYEEYNTASFQTIKKEINKRIGAEEVIWFNIHGLHDVTLIKEIGEFLELENYIIGDILNTSKRTRLEDLHGISFFSVKSIIPESGEAALSTEQISFVLKKNIIISFQEKKSDYFTHIRERIRTGSGIVRKKANDYLFYLMLDAIMENFFITIEANEDKIEALNTEHKFSYRKDFVLRIEKYRESLNFLKRSINPLREALFILKSSKEEEDYKSIHKSSHAYFARLHQKSLELLDQIEYDMSTLESISNFHFSSQNQRMNQIMKTLTIFSVIFMPLTFIVGVYGMNFHNMPELRFKYGYYIVLFIMAVIFIGMIYYFKRKKWF